MPILPVTRIETVTEPVEVQMWQYSVTRADAASPAEIVVLFRPLDAEGRWDMSARPIRVVLRDAPALPEGSTVDPELAATVASDVRAAMLQALVQECPEVERLQALTGLSLAGKSFQQFGEGLVLKLVELGLAQKSEG